MKTYTIQYHTPDFTLNFNGESFEEGGMFDIQHFDRIEDARSAIDENNNSECLEGSWFTITEEVFDDETQDVAGEVVETIQSTS